MASKVGAKRGRDLLATIKNHPDKARCPGCGQNVSAVALVELVYTFEPCDCEAAPYKHLIDTIWHRACFHRVPRTTSTVPGEQK